VKSKGRVLITRTDRLGDVLMTLHSLKAIRESLPEIEIDFLIRSELGPVLRPLLSQWNVHLRYGVEDLQKYNAALCLFEEPGVLDYLKRQGVPVRVGNYSKWSSFLKLTHGVRQRRALGLKNEGEYNLDLARLFLGVLGVHPRYSPVPFALPVDANAEKEAATALKRIGIQLGDPFWIAHPGMGGSALNMGASGYLEMLVHLERQMPGPLLLSLGPAPADLVLVDALLESRPDWRVLPRVSLSALGEVFRHAQTVVAPSTGPLHLAHYVGARTLGIYSPVRSHQPRRWAPWGGSGVSQVLVPEKPCPGKRDCLGKKCPHFYCMDSLLSTGLPSPVLSALTSS
jgi:ADP-heptose:LPS heptosyltransferase